jgi:hypothetical protein
MAKKFYDVLPPGMKKEEITVAPRKRVCFSFKKKWILVFLVLFFVLSQTLLLKAEIIVYPETEKVEYLGEISVGLEDELIIAEVFQLKEEETRIFSSSGKEKEEKKAQGTIKVYNNHSSSPQTLVANTRFISSDGKLFYSQERILVPGQRKEGNRTLPGEATVEIKAAEAGQEYNIERKTKFSIPGLQGTAMYSFVYAENLEPITGGYVGEMPKILNQDLISAKQVLIEDIVDKAQKKLEQEISDDFVIDKNLMNYQIIEESFYPGLNENSESFEYSIKLELELISYKKSLLNQEIKKRLTDQFSEQEMPDKIFSSKKINQESLEINTGFSKVDLKGKTLILEVKVSADSYHDINKDFLKSVLIKEKINEVKENLESYDEIRQVRIKKWPFWLGRLPSPGKIKISVRID